MPVFHTPLRQPTAAMWYTSLGPLTLSLFILICGLFFATSAAVTASISSPLIVFLIVATIVLLLAYPILYYILFSYELTEHTITVNSGIIFREYETIEFGRIQVIDNERGPLLWLFGLTEVRIWTASADQLTMSLGEHSTQMHPHPDTTLLLEKDDAAQLKDFIMRAKTGSGNL